MKKYIYLVNSNVYLNTLTVVEKFTIYNHCYSNYSNFPDETF